jgi:hypothetical protein
VVPTPSRLPDWGVCAHTLAKLLGTHRF